MYQIKRCRTCNHKINVHKYSGYYKFRNVCEHVPRSERATNKDLNYYLRWRYGKESMSSLWKRKILYASKVHQHLVSMHRLWLRQQDRNSGRIKMQLLFHHFWKTVTGIMITITGLVAFIQSSIRMMILPMIMILIGLFVMSISEEDKWKSYYMVQQYAVVVGLLRWCLIKETYHTSMLI